MTTDHGPACFLPQPSLIDVGYAVRTCGGGERYAQRTLRIGSDTGNVRPIQGSSFRPNLKGSKAQGFTLIELLVVLAIISLLAGLVGPQVMKHLGESKSKTARVQVEELAATLDMYRLDVGRYPAMEEGLTALVEKPAGAMVWNGPYLRKKKVPLDPWGNPYHYKSPGEHGKFDLYSLGADNAGGGEGEDQDILSWE